MKVPLRETPWLPVRWAVPAILPVLTVVVVVLLWEGVARLLRVPVWILPSPLSIVQATAAWGSRLPYHVGVTLYETLAGFGIAIAVGIPLAALVVHVPILYSTFYPLLLGLQSVPKVAIAPLLLIWLGYGELPKIVVVFLVCFFPIVVSTVTGLTAVPPELMDLVRSLSPSTSQVFVKIRFPTSLPYLFVGLKVAITLAVIGAVIGEFVSAERGLGYLILAATSQLNTSLGFGALALLTIMSILLYYGVEALERLISPWARS
ncbi:MAG: ABC transporter permease [Armatimonadota bacterium]|nr:ABC transporter permease [Armatimonadota bacterium]MDR7401138.1 ABC transporter permease [Armatimonadota bacterium]MDR7404338.1 ABC transporter permease [Armatimonadota bacterium]MDR7436433.1 ABC transporter permease [Armatimonadota bacterium]MDR7471792.1 ABC transporter permease [Armatimonadota bacterium]